MVTQGDNSKLESAVALLQNGRLSQAEALLKEILQSWPQHPYALYLLAILALQKNDSESAIELFDRVLAIDPAHANALYNRGNALANLKRYEEALVSYDSAIKISPVFCEAIYNRGTVLAELNRNKEALASYDRALQIMPAFAEAFNNRGSALAGLGRHEEALESFDRALELQPTFAEAHNNRGNAWRALRRNEEALESYDRAIKYKPRYADAFFNRGNALVGLKRNEEALESYDQALRIAPDLVRALCSRAEVLQEKKQYHAALESYGKAVSLRPDDAFVLGMLLSAKMKICSWDDEENKLNRLLKCLQQGGKVSPLPVLAITSSPSLQRKAAETWTNDNHPAIYDLPRISKRPRHDKIRVGYYSADFRDHAVARLVAELFECHNRNKFELFAFSFGPDSEDEIRQRVAAAFDKFIDVRDRSDKAVALLSREFEIDIAVDLTGFTQYNRAGIFAHGAAPLQVNYLGYPGTMGADYVDYVIADHILIPEKSRQYYSEKIAYLPNSYQANDGKKHIAEKVFTREELGLPDKGFVFCCFNNNFKITPDTFDGWMRILKQVAGSVLWLLEDNTVAANNLRREAEKRGVAGGRLIFAGRLPQEEHLARHRAADLFIDTLPYNAHTTASDSLWSGLPVLTCTAESFASRVAASLLTAIDLPDLIASTQEEYEALAIALATQPERLREVRERLARNRLTTPLFDAKLFAGHIEFAYTQMYERYQADLPPNHIYVPS